jgi:hypothetical protein
LKQVHQWKTRLQKKHKGTNNNENKGKKNVKKCTKATKAKNNDEALLNDSLKKQ